MNFYLMGFAGALPILPLKENWKDNDKYKYSKI